MPSQAFAIPDTSPLFAYTPCTNCGNSTGWLSAYSPRGDGFDQTFHQSLSAQSTIAFNITATSLVVQTSEMGPPCVMQFSINGSEPASACGDSALSSLPLGLHRVVLQPSGPKPVRFYGVSGTFELASQGSQYANKTVDSTASGFTYSTGWVSLPTGSDAASDTVIASQYSDLSRFYNRTASITTQRGAWANYTFGGSAEAVYLYGMSGPEGGAAEVYLDGVLQDRLNLTNAWRTYSSLLFAAPSLDATVNHTISVVNVQAGGHLVLDYAKVTRAVPDKVSPQLTAILGGVSGGVAGLLLLLVGVYFWLAKCRDNARKASTSQVPYGFSTGLGGKGVGGDLPSSSSASSGMSNSSALDQWRRMQKLSPQGLASNNSLTPHSPITPFSVASTSRSGTDPISAKSSGTGAGSMTAYGQPKLRVFNSPPPEYNDYIPYNGPISSPPANQDALYSAPRSSQPQRGSNGWRVADRSPRPSVRTLESEAGGRSAASGRTGLSSRGDRPSARRSVSYGAGQDLALPPSLDRDTSSTRYSYYPYESPIGSGRRPTSTQPPLSALSSEVSEAQMGMGRAVEATRSVARLWPTRAAVPSHYVTSALEEATGGGLGPSSVAAQPPGSSAGGAGGRYLPSEVPFSFMDSDPAPAHDRPSSTSLRRGVSVKSVKTVRSFFSGLLGGGGGGGGGMGFGHSVASSTAGPASAARPDSDIFPSEGIILPPMPSGTSAGGGGGGYQVAADLFRGNSRGAASLAAARNNAPSRNTIRRVPVPAAEPLAASSLGSRTLRLEPRRSSPTNFFIELNPNSPMTELSRRDSEMTTWR